MTRHAHPVAMVVGAVPATSIEAQAWLDGCVASCDMPGRGLVSRKACRERAVAVIEINGELRRAVCAGALAYLTRIAGVERVTRSI